MDASGAASRSSDVRVECNEQSESNECGSPAHSPDDSDDAVQVDASTKLTKNQRRKIKKRRRARELRAMGIAPKRRKRRHGSGGGEDTREQGQGSSERGGCDTEEAASASHGAAQEDLSDEERGKVAYAIGRESITHFLGLIVEHMKLHEYERECTELASDSHARLSEMLRKERVPVAFLARLLRIKECLLAGGFSQASEVYFEMAIGAMDQDKHNVFKGLKRMISYYEQRISPLVS